MLTPFILIGLHDGASQVPPPSTTGTFDGFTSFGALKLFDGFSESSGVGQASTAHEWVIRARRRGKR